MLQDIENKQRIAIVAVGYNRIDSLERLFHSLDRAKYQVENVPLYISIDCSGDTELYEYVRNYEWKHGDKYVNIQKKRLGLRNHILQCGDLTKYFKGIVLLEDDIYVSEYFYQYVCDAVDYYGDDEHIGGISLHRNEMGGNIPITLLQDGNDVFLRQSVATWGECWTECMWKGFRKWYDSPASQDFGPYDMPLEIKKWGKAWSKYYMAYQLQTNKYFLFPSVSLTTCFNEAGEHGLSCTIGQVNLLMGPKKFQFLPFDKLSRYDIYSTNEDIYKWIEIPKEELCVNFRGNNPNMEGKKYMLTPYEYPYKVVDEYSLSLFPIELNIKDKLKGKGIYLYDTTVVNGKTKKRKHPLSLAYYHLRTFNVFLLMRYVCHYTLCSAKAKIKKRCKKTLTRR